MSIYLRQVQSYTRILRNPDAGRNLGIIEHNGTLNFKPRLREMLSAEGTDARRHNHWHAANHGRTRGVAGSGYEGYIEFENFHAAVEHLEQYFDLM